jgi:hypothetical protein
VTTFSQKQLEAVKEFVRAEVADKVGGDLYDSVRKNDATAELEAAFTDGAVSHNPTPPPHYEQDGVHPDERFLLWVAERLVMLGEHPNVDFVLRMKALAKQLGKK